MIQVATPGFAKKGFKALNRGAPAALLSNARYVFTKHGILFVWQLRCKRRVFAACRVQLFWFGNERLFHANIAQLRPAISFFESPNYPVTGAFDKRYLVALAPVNHLQIPLICPVVARFFMSKNALNIELLSQPGKYLRCFSCFNRKRCAQIGKVGIEFYQTIVNKVPVPARCKGL